MADTGLFGSALSSIFGGGGDAPTGAANGADVPPDAAPSAPSAPQQEPQSRGGIFGSGIDFGPRYKAPDPQTSPLDQTADFLQQRITRANAVATNPILQVLNPEGVQAARQFVPQATEALQKIRQQKADIAANRQQAETLGLAPGEVADEASTANRVEVAKARALKGDLRVFKGLQAVDPKAAEAIQDQVQEVVAGHLSKAQYAFDSLSSVQNQGQYTAKLDQLRREGALTDLETLGLKVPTSFDVFSAAKAREGQALREAQIGIANLRQKLEDRNTYQPMEKKEAETYTGRMTTAFGDQITNGTWARNGASGTRGLVVNGMDDPRNLGKSFTLATQEQRKAIREEMEAAVPKADIEKYRAFNRTYDLATKDAKGNPLKDGEINTNPNVQQAVSEGLASMLRGGQGGANVGLLNIESGKRAAVQTILDKIVANYAGGVNAITGEGVKPYLTQLTQSQIRDVMDALKAYNDTSINDRAANIAQRAGALGLDAAALGLGSKETAGALADALEQGRTAQIERMMLSHQAIGGGDGVLQLGAQRTGAGSTALPPGAPAVNQAPGGDRLATPVQQAQGQPNPSAPSVGSTGPQTPGAPQQVQVAGQQIAAALPPGASNSYVSRLQRIETGNERNPWTASTPGSSAGGAFQFIKSTWAANKPAGAPDDPRQATPQQQAEALATLTNRNAAVLRDNKLPVDDTTLYMAHNVGAGGATALLKADLNADARSIVGEAAARNNPMFFKGKPTVATVIGRYQAQMAQDISDAVPRGPAPSGGGATTATGDDKPSLLRRISRALTAGIPGDDAAKDKAVSDVGDAATEHAPAIGSTIGAFAGAPGGVPGMVAGGGAGGAAGQALKDYLQGRPQSPAEIAKQGALGAVLGVGVEGRPIASAVMRATGAGGVEAGATAAEGGSAADTIDAGVKGAGMGAAGEAFGRALGMAGHKVFNMFAPEAKTAIRDAAQKYSEASETLRTEAPTIPGANGAKSTPNPKYEAAERTRTEAEQTLKDAGLKPEEAAYAYKVSRTEEGVPPMGRQEAEVSRPGALEKERLGEGYRRLETAIGEKGVGAPKAAGRLPDGPLAAVEKKQVSAKHAELAERVEMAITAPAANWREKWVQLKDARSELLDAERDAISSTAPGRTKIAEDMRTLADTVRKQQEKAAKYVFGEKDGEKFMSWLRVLDVRYRNLMEATNGGDLVKAAAMKGEAGREANKKFRAFAADDPVALAAWDAMRAAKGDVERDVRTLVGAERIPVLGQLVSGVKLASAFREWARERAAGNPVRFEDLIKTKTGDAEVGRTMRDMVGTAAQRGAVMQ